MTAAAWSAAALLLGFLLDAAVGDPQGFPHIVRLMGKLVSALEERLPRSVTGGFMLTLITASVFTAAPLAALALCYRAAPPLGCALESLLCFQLLAARSLKTESMRVCRSLRDGDLERARAEASMIVGRDVSALDGEGITRAAVETVAENASDGVIAPLFYITLGGGPLGCLFKAVSTMDSMVGYKNERYIDLGRASAKADDVLCYIPSRVSAALMLAAAFLLGLDGKGAYRVWRRDRRKHESPNSAQTEAVCAGALGLRLAGPAVYFGKRREKPYIGDDTRPIRPDDIEAVNRLMLAASALALVLALLVRALFLGVLYYAGL